MTDEYCADDGARLYPRELWSYLVRLMYARRNKGDPLWNQLVVGGFRDGKSFLGMVDLHGAHSLVDIARLPYSPRCQVRATRTTRSLLAMAHTLHGR